MPDAWAESQPGSTSVVKAKRRFLLTGIVVGSILTLSPLFGLLGTVLGMTRAFRMLGSAGVSDPQALANSIGTMLVSTAAGLCLCPVGIVVFTLSLVFFLRLRAATPPPLPPPVR